MSIQQNFPAISPSLSLNFARSKTLDPRITFSRTSTATRVNETGLIEVMSADEPRFDHKYENGVVKSLGLLIEEQRSNLVTYSEDFNNWTVQSNTTVTPNNLISPSGEQDAYLITSNLTETAIYTTVTSSQNQSYTYSVFLKSGTVTKIRLRDLDGGSNPGHNVSFDLSTLSFFDVSGNTVDKGYIEYPNDWYRIWFTFTTGTYTNLSFNIRPTDSQTGTFYVWGAQLEAGAFPTSYIPTEGSTKTRSPDNVSMIGTNFSDWYNQNEGTISCSFRAQSSETKYLMGISNNSAAELIYIRATSTGSDSAMRDGGSDVAYKPIAYSRDIDTLSKHCVSYKQDDFIVSAQGQISTVDDGCTVPTPTNISIGSLYNTTQLGGTISQLTYYPKRLTNTQLQNLTK